MYLKTAYAFLITILLSVRVSLAQLSGPPTQPMSTTGTNRMQELYDQYHGYNKKNEPRAPASTSSTDSQKSNGSYKGNVATSESKSEAEIAQAGVRIGIRGGVSRWYFTEDQPLLEPAVGFVGGLVFNFGVGTFSFQPEINYARYNLKYSGLSVEGSVDEIEVPLFLKIASGTYAGHRFFVNVGPYVSYLASLSYNGKKQPIESYVNRFQLGASAGVGAALKAGPGHVTLEVRGLYPFGTSNNGFISNSKVISGQATIGYSFPM